MKAYLKALGAVLSIFGLIIVIGLGAIWIAGEIASRFGPEGVVMVIILGVALAVAWMLKDEFE